MKPFSKLCDAIDWADPEFDRVIRSELEEPPCFHRKQWEFAQIFRTLQALGYLSPRTCGLSMGAGQERLMYAVARRAGHLTAVDLYDSTSDWDTARTSEPDRAVKAAAPFAIDPSSLSARRMDMRELAFADRTFDFCYSSCAIEHIGDRPDFLRHLREVRRVLKDDGVYVLTTEFHYGDETVPAPHNYYFSAGYLHDLLGEASLATVGGVSGAVGRHACNSLLPEKLGDLCHDPTDGITARLLKSAPHVQLLTASLPFTSLCLVVRKGEPGASPGVVPVADIEGSRRFIDEGVREWRAFVERTRLSLDPFGLFGDARPARGQPRLVAAGGDDTAFHTGYVWLGGAARTITVDLEAWPGDGGAAAIEIRVHRQPSLRPNEVTRAHAATVAVRGREPVHLDVCLAPDAACSYAVLGKVCSGSCWIGHVGVGVGER
jgi:SAM-dependent methyltransferase